MTSSLLSALIMVSPTSCGLCRHPDERRPTESTRCARSLRSPGNADQVALRVGEMADHQACRRSFRAHPAFAAEPLGFGQGGLYIGYADVEDDGARVGGASA